MFNVQALKEQISLSQVVEADLGRGKKSGQWLMFRCPFHEDKNPSMGVKGDGFRCFACGAHGDVIDYVMRRRGIGFQEACEWLNAPEHTAALPAPRRRGIPVQIEPPTREWQAAAKRIVLEANERLLNAPEAESARLYLERRGISLETTRNASLGYVPGTIKDTWPILYGLKTPPGILIPWFADGALWRVNVRRPTNEKSQRYRNIAGGSGEGLFVAGQVERGRPLLVTEGEFDALIASQTVGGIVSVVTAGGATNRISQRWLGIFAQTPLILAAHDTDDAGQKAAAALRNMTACVRRVDLPDGKDVTDYIVAGGDFRALVEGEIAKFAAATTESTPDSGAAAPDLGLAGDNQPPIPPVLVTKLVKPRRHTFDDIPRLAKEHPGCLLHFKEIDGRLVGEWRPRQPGEQSAFEFFEQRKEKINHC